MRNWIPLTLCLLISFVSKGNWQNINSTIQDELTCITFKSNVGLITGKKGAYFSTTGGTTAASWSRAQSYFNSSDSAIYNHSQFFGCVSSASSQKIYLCGKDTVANRSVIFSFDATTFQLHSEYVGDIGTKLNKIAFYNSNGTYYTVGNNGLIVTFTSAGNYQVLSTSFTCNLNSVSISNTTLLIGAENYLIRAPISNMNFVINSHLNRNFKDYAGLQNTGDYAAIGKNFARETSNAYSEPHNYFADSLSGNDLFYYGSQTFIGTNSGIYKTSGTTNVIEYQPTSGTYAILSIINSGSILFACGKNGVILYSNSQGGTPLPYAEIISSGGCVNTNLSVSALKGTVSTCNWTIDGVFVSNQCNAFNYNTPTPGAHVIRFIFGNGTINDTVYKTIQTVTVPLINKTVSISDSILCHSEAIDVTVMNSQSNVYYTLYKQGTTPDFGSSVGGNGSDLVFTSGMIDQAGIYYLKASSTLASCSANFTNTIAIAVEKTKADFYVGLINAEMNEITPFYEHCKEAANYLWTFSNQPASLNSSLADPSMSFTGLGQSTTKLLAWSINGCYDSIVKSGPFVYVEPTVVDSCFLLTVNGGNADWNGVYASDIVDLKKSADGGFLIAGRTESSLVGSKYGTSYQTNYNGVYTAKYNKSGVLKWLINGHEGNLLYQWDDEIYDIDEDTDHHLYVVGNVGTSGYTADNYFIDNRGDTVFICRSYLLKFDENGRIIWERGSIVAQFYSVNFANNQDPWMTVGGNQPSGLNGQQPWVIYDHMIPVDTIQGTTAVDPILGYHFRYFMSHFNTTGDYLSRFAVQADGIGKPPKLLFDASNNMILYGSTDVYGIVEEPSTGDLINLPYNASQSGHHMYILKFDSGGNYLWQTYGITHFQNNTYDYGECDVYAAVLDANGNVYVTGKNAHLATGPFSIYPMKIFNSDNTITAFNGGEFFIAKINTSGICEWINGNQSTFYGIGYDLIMENDHLKALVEMNNASGNFDSTHFTSQNGATIEVNNYGSQDFIVDYDLDGNLRSVVESGTDVEHYSSIFIGNRRFSRLNDGTYVLTSNYMTGYYGNIPFMFFGDTVPMPADPPFGDYNYPGLISKFVPGCGIQHIPQYITNSIVTVCYGDDFTFPDGTVAGNITDTVYHESNLTAVNGYDSIVRTTIHTHQFNNVVNQTIDSLYTTQTAASYQWINCDLGNAAVSGGNSTAISPSATGNYALILQQGNCIDTSDCIHGPSFLNYSSVTVCYGDDFTFPDGTVMSNIVDSAYHESILTALNGFDSIVRTTVDTYTFNNIIHQTTTSLYSTESAGTYQWVNCNQGYASIPGANSSSFIPPNTGNYALVLGQGNCMDTSDCIYFHHQPFIIYSTVTVCHGDNFTFPDGTVANNIIDSVYHESVLTASDGNDSILRITVHSIQFNNSIHQTANSLYTTEIAASYHWVDCNQGFSVIPGASSQTFIPSASGDYALILQQGDCADTSDCVHYDLEVGLTENPGLLEVSVAPNPTNSVVEIKLNQQLENCKLEVLTDQGVVLETKSMDQSTYTLKLDYPQGNYFIRISTPENGVKILKVVKI